MSILLGTSGFQYRSWKEAFYGGVKQANWLEHYASAFDTVEINNAFYRLPEREVFERWAQRTPKDFVVGVKMSRYLTHIKRLKDPQEPVQRFLDHARGLGPKLGPVLLQLPPNLSANVEALEQTLRLFPSEVKVAVEVRHESWHTNDCREVLEKYNAALCLFDTPVRQGVNWRTSDWGYVRFHEGTSTPRPCYSRQRLRSWASRITDMWGEGDDVFVFFNNDPNVCAVRDAGWFGQEVERLGRTCSRYPDPKTIAVTR